MPIERWQNLPIYELPQPQPGQPPQPLRMTGLWLRVAELLPANRIIKIAASGTWSDLRAGLPIGPDGYLDLTIPADQLIASNAPAGALMGKIGGSTADKITDDKKKDSITIFPIGTFCVVAPLDKAAPLFVAVNGAWSLAEFHFLTLRVEISTSES